MKRLIKPRLLEQAAVNATVPRGPSLLQALSGGNRRLLSWFEDTADMFHVACRRAGGLDHEPELSTAFFHRPGGAQLELSRSVR